MVYSRHPNRTTWATESTRSGYTCWKMRMWGLRKTSIVPDDYTCVKFTQLHLLGDHARELELEPDVIRIIRDAEHVIDKSFSEVVT
eukprot:g31125.t1